MSRRLFVRPEVLVDLREAYDWYEEQSYGLGLKFLRAIDDVFEQICDMPEMYAVEWKAVRRAGTNRFPYVVYYQMLGDDVIEVIAVLHGSRHRRVWRSRM